LHSLHRLHSLAGSWRCGPGAVGARRQEERTDHEGGSPSDRRLHHGVRETEVRVFGPLCRSSRSRACPTLACAPTRFRHPPRCSARKDSGSRLFSSCSWTPEARLRDR
jgi:hypothetical protein